MSSLLRSLSACVGVFSLGAVVSPAAVAATATSSSFTGYSAVGALFPNTSASGYHSCTASVVTSGSRDTLITAAHCVHGSGTSYSFAPGYVGGAKPYGVWHVTHAYVDSRWKYGQNSAYDVAVLTVARNSKGQNIQDVTGANVLRSAPGTGQTISVPAYNAGMNDRPIRCSAPAFYTQGYPGFNCSNYNTGVSGAPFVQTSGRSTYVSGVIGGLHQGGCYPTTSYSSPFGSAEQYLLNRAQRKLAADIVPYPGSDGC